MHLQKENICQEILNQVGRGTYVEIGVRYGDSFNSIHADRKIGVDPAGRLYRLKQRSLIGRILHNRYFRSTKEALLDFTKREQFFAVTSDQFFATHASLLSNQGIDVALVDGLHSYGQSLEDVRNCLKYLNAGGAIVLDDCNPRSELAALPATSFEQVIEQHPDCPSWQGDVWKTIVNLRSLADDLEVMVFDVDWGIGVVRKGRPQSMLSYSVEEIDAMTYKNLESQREELLNLKPADHFSAFLESIR